MYGTRSAWLRFIEKYTARVRQIVLEPAAHAKLCADQDIMQDLHLDHPHLLEEFTTADGWGWQDARKALVECPANTVNMANRCRPENSSNWCEISRGKKG